MKAYVKDMTGLELPTDINGLNVASLGASMTITGRLSCEEDAPILTDLKGRRIRRSFSVWMAEPGAKREVSIADFPGMQQVMIRCWSPAGDSSFWLI